jgi:hypothetical protein
MTRKARQTLTDPVSNSAALTPRFPQPLCPAELLGLLLRLSDELDAFFDDVGAHREPSRNREPARRS